MEEIYMQERKYFAFYDQEQPEQMPIIGIFDFPAEVDTLDIQKTVKAAYNVWNAKLDCPPIRYAADRICKKYGATVELVEADLVFDMPTGNSPVCAQCGRILDERSDSMAPCPYNVGFDDETVVCNACKDSMLERGELLCCGSCGYCFTVEHLAPVIPGSDDCSEKCPNCGEIVYE